MRLAAILAVALIVAAVATPRRRPAKYVARPRTFLTPQGAYFSWLMGQP